MTKNRNAKIPLRMGKENGAFYKIDPEKEKSRGFEILKDFNM